MNKEDNRKAPTLWSEMMLIYAGMLQEKGTSWTGKQIGRALLSGICLLMQYLMVPALALWFVLTITYTNGVYELSPDSETVITMLGYIASLYFIVAHNVKKGIPMSRAAGLGGNMLNKATLGYLFAAGLLFAIAISSFLGMFSTEVLEDYYVSTYGTIQKQQLMLSLFSIMVFAPINEELFFRGFLMNRMMTGMGRWMAMVISAIIFALLHINPVWICYALVMGLLLGSVRLIFDELSAAVALHAGFNFSVLISLALPPGSPAGRIIFGNRLMLAVYTVAGVIAAGYLLVRAFRLASENA